MMEKVQKLRNTNSNTDSLHTEVWKMACVMAAFGEIMLETFLYNSELESWKFMSKSHMQVFSALVDTISYVLFRPFLTKFAKHTILIGT